MKEIETVMKEAKNRKAPGCDNINMELWKYGGKKLKIRLLQLFNLIWNEGRIPEEWYTANIVNIYKKGSRNECGNYRGISLLTTAYKLYSAVLKKKLYPILETILGEEQNGFRKRRSCIYAIFTIKQILEKISEYNLQSCLLFIDYIKAYDRVQRNKLWKIMEEYKIPFNLINSIKSLYSKTRITIKEESTYVNKGLRQGCGLSPILFDLYLNRIIENWRTKYKPKGIVLKKNTHIDTIVFADDQVLLADSETELQRAIKYLNEIGKEYNMKISGKKTKAMAMIGREQKRMKIVIDEEIIEQVSTFKYLGSKISIYNTKADIEENIETYNKINGCIKRHFGKSMRREVKQRIHNIVSKPALKYSCETWVLGSREKSRLEAAQMRFLRPLMGVTRLDRLRNVDIRAQLMENNIIEEVQYYQKEWKDHVLRMPPSRYPRQALFYQPSGRRNIGRQRRRWSDQFT